VIDMYSKRFKFFAVFIVVTIIVFIVPIVSAENTPALTSSTNGTTTTAASSEELFITIDPIGDHIIGEVFFINGTTNLPVSGNLTLGMEALSYIMRPHQKGETGPGPHGSANLPALPISPALPGLNRWSANVTDIVKELESGEYEVSVFPPLRGPCNTTGCNIPKAEADQIFTLFPAKNGTSVSVSQTASQSPTQILFTPSTTLVLPSKQFSPLPSVLPIAVLVTIVILKPIQGKKRD